MQSQTVKILPYPQMQDKVLKNEQDNKKIINNFPVAKVHILKPQEKFLLQRDHIYFIHGYGDNKLRLLDGNYANVLQELEYIDDIDAVITSGELIYDDGIGSGLYWQMFRCWIRDRSIEKVGRYTDWQQHALKEVWVHNEFNPATDGSGSGYAYIYDYGCPKEGW